MNKHTALWMAVFEWVAAIEIVCKDSVGRDKGRGLLCPFKTLTTYQRQTGTLRARDTLIYNLHYIKSKRWMALLNPASSVPLEQTFFSDLNRYCGSMGEQSSFVCVWGSQDTQSKSRLNQGKEISL